MTVRAHRAPSPEALASAFTAGRVDVAWISPALFITSAAFERARPIVCSIRQGMATYHAVLFVDAVSPIRSVSQLAGSRVAWVSKTSAAGYIVPRLALASHGYDPRGLFSRETFHDSHGNVARAVLEGAADVGATYAVFEEGDAASKMIRAGFTEIPEGARARILYAAGPIPSDPVVVAEDVDAKSRIALLEAFTGDLAPVREAISHVIGAEAFEPVRRGSFDSLREQIQDGRTLGLLDGPTQ